MHQCRAGMHRSRANVSEVIECVQFAKLQCNYKLPDWVVFSHAPVTF